MILKQPAQMTERDLEARIEFHESTARMFAEHGYPTRGAEFQELTEPYRTELEKRRKYGAA